MCQSDAGSALSDSNQKDSCNQCSVSTRNYLLALTSPHRLLFLARPILKCTTSSTTPASQMLPYELGHCSNTLGGYNYLPNPGVACHSLNCLFVLCRWSATLKALLFSLCNKAQVLSFVMPQSTFMSTVHTSTMCTIKHQPEYSFSTCLPRKSCCLRCHCPPAWWERINKSRNSQTSEEKLLEWQRRAGRQQTTPFQENRRLHWKSPSWQLSAGDQAGGKAVMDKLL